MREEQRYHSSKGPDQPVISVPPRLFWVSLQLRSKPSWSHLHTSLFQSEHGRDGPLTQPLVPVLGGPAVCFLDAPLLKHT